MASHNYFKWQKNKFYNIQLVNNWIKYKLGLVFEYHLWQTQAEIQVWLVTSPSTGHTLNTFSSVLDDLQKLPLWGAGGLFPQFPRGAAPVWPIRATVCVYDLLCLMLGIINNTVSTTTVFTITFGKINAFHKK